MLRLYTVLLFCFIINIQIHAQSVGLVLSGGGARGITHIGVIKALEENNIPIDYIAGTSMGAVVGSMYAMGYNMDEVISILKSDDFKRWSTGEMDPNYIFYYRSADPNPGLVDFHFDLNKRDSIRIRSRLLPTNLISPIQMNYAFLELYSQATAYSGGDFDKLFVPFRCVASDVYAKKTVMSRSGNLGDAVRASMTFPFVFKPISINDQLLFDGGIYNNFPVDIMKEEFHPDFIIGSVVSRNPEKPGDDDLLQQISNMIMSKTDYSIPEEEGVMLDFELKSINTFDFSKVDELVKMGYDSTIARIDLIKSKVARRVAPDVIEGNRLKFRSNFADLRFKNIVVDGVNSLQRNYIQSTFKLRDSIISLAEMKEKYFQLVSDDKISEVNPQAIFNPNTGFFDLRLGIRAQDKLKLTFGGNISSSTSNEAYFGLVHQTLKEFAQMTYADAQFGTMYNAIGFGTRIDVLGARNMYVKLSAVFHRFDYFRTNHLFFTDDTFNESTQYELYSKFSIGMPLTLKGRMEFGLGYGNLTDYYRLQSTGADRSVFNIGSAFVNIKTYSHNSRMYPTAGGDHSVALSLFTGDEHFRSGNYNMPNLNGSFDLWGQFSANYDHYYKINKHIILGTQADLMISTRKLLSNYMVTLTQAPVFRPTVHSQTVFKPAFAANQYLALGLKPIYYINERFQWRNEVYLFAPYRKFLPTTGFQAKYSDIFPSIEVIAETALVFDFKFAKTSAFVTYYSSTAVSPVVFGVNIGFILFNKKFMY